MSPNTLSVPALALAVALGAMALPGTAAAYPQITGGNRDLVVTYGPAPGDTIVGGATARIQGGGRNDTFYSALPGGQAREGRIGIMTGGGRDAAVVYQDGMPHRWAGTAADTDDRGHGG